MITTVFFDIDDTLLDFNESAKQSMRAASKKLDMPYDDEHFELFRQINCDLWHKLERGEITRDDIFVARWAAVYRELGIPADAEAFEREFLSALDTSAVPVDGALELLEYLYPDYTLCIASNGPYDQQVSRLSRAGMLKYFSHLFISERVGCTKPHSGFFDYCFDTLSGTLPSETMMIGDSLSADMKGAADYGMYTCHYDPIGIYLDKLIPINFHVFTLSAVRDIL